MSVSNEKLFAMNEAYSYKQDDAKMPTIILLDLSLSMFRPIPSSDSAEHHTRFSLACTAINTFLDYLNVNAKLEYVALVTFSSVYDVAVPFTRDLEVIRSKLPQLEEGDKTCLSTALAGVNQLALSEWGHQTLVQIVLVTDGSSGVGPIGRTRVLSAVPLPPRYPARLLVLPLAAPHDPALHHAMPLYQQLVDLASSGTNHAVPVARGAIYCPDQLSVPGVSSCVSRLCGAQYVPCVGTVRCGRLEARVLLTPPHQHTVLTVIGFIAAHHLGTPITVSKHLIIPQPQPGATRDTYDHKTTPKDGSSSNDGSTADEDSSDPSKIPNFCVLLHGALKIGTVQCIRLVPFTRSQYSPGLLDCLVNWVEGMCALVQLSAERHGVLSASCEQTSRARRSCLLLAVLAERAPAPWLGPLHQLGPEPVGESFPIVAVRSYSSTNQSARPHALLADVQKVIRHARKLPEKTTHLYKELNRLRRAAISLGFSELLTCVEAALVRECSSLPPEAALQLAHAAAALSDPRTALDVTHTLQPLQTAGHAATGH